MRRVGVCGDLVASYTSVWVLCEVLCGEGRVKKKKGTKRKGDGKRSVFFCGDAEIGKWEGDFSLDREVGMTMGVGQVGVLMERRPFHYCHEQNE